jgi:hypothetical protein
MRVDHINVQLALLLEDPLRSAAVILICKSYSAGAATYIWSQVKPHIQLPPFHPLAEANLARGNILAMIQAAYTAPEPATKNTQTLMDLVSVAIPVEIFILYTAITLREEEMVTHTPLHRHPTSGWLTLLSLTYGALAAVLALPG